jgi:NADP-dependent 3-hydroxy acid dehydrogenase YdfG
VPQFAHRSDKWNHNTGLALIDAVASKDPSAIVYAGAREPLTLGSGSSKLKDVANKYPGRVEIVKYVAGDKEDTTALAKKLGEKHGRVDTVIANAGAFFRC